jgi:outer membrane protein W
MRRVLKMVPLVLTLSSFAASASAQGSPTGARVYAGGLFGVSTLSADAAAVTSAAGASVSMYKPENGPALNLFAGVHLAQYFSVQGNWMWNRNELSLIAATTHNGAFYEQPRQSHQHALVLDGLIYFRRLDSAVRPYLGTGLSIIRFSSDAIGTATGEGIMPPPGTIASTHIGLRSHVGIDLRLNGRVAFRYSFSETISGNPVSAHLTPPGPRRLANFQNLFGLISRF